MPIVRALFSKYLFNWCTQGSESVVYLWEYSATFINNVFCFILPANTDFCWPPSCRGFLDFVLCFYWGGGKMWDSTNFFFCHGIHKRFVLPILLKGVAILRDFHLVCGLKFDSSMEKGEYWGSNAQCLFLRQPSLLSFCLPGNAETHSKWRGKNSTDSNWLIV